MCAGLHGRYPEWVDPVNGTHHRYLFTYNLQQKNANMTLQGMQRAVHLLGTSFAVHCQHPQQVHRADLDNARCSTLPTYRGSGGGAAGWARGPWGTVGGRPPLGGVCHERAQSAPDVPEGRRLHPRGALSCVDISLPVLSLVRKRLVPCDSTFHATAQRRGRADGGDHFDCHWAAAGHEPVGPPPGAMSHD